MKRMAHKDHGFCHAETPHEEARLRLQGWIDDDGQALRRKLELSNAAPQGTDDKLSPPGGASDPDGAAPDIESLRAQLDELGIPYDKRLGAAKLTALLQ